MSGKKKLEVVKPKRPPIETIVQDMLRTFLETQATELRIQLDTTKNKGIMVTFETTTRIMESEND